MEGFMANLSLTAIRWNLYLVGFNVYLLREKYLASHSWKLYLVGFNVDLVSGQLPSCHGWKLYLVGFNMAHGINNPPLCPLLEIVLDRVQCRDNAKALHLTMLVGTCT